MILRPRRKQPEQNPRGMLTRREMLSLGLTAAMAESLFALEDALGQYGRLATPSGTNPLALSDSSGGNVGYNDLTGKTPSTPTISGTTAIGISFGQSLDGNHSDGTYAPTNPTKIHNLNPYTGLTYQSLQPLLGCSGNAAHWWPETQDILVTNSVFTDVILCPIAIAGTTLTDIASGFASYRTVVAIMRCRTFGIPITFYHCMQGQSGPNTKAAWMEQANKIRDTIAGMRAEAPIFLDKSTMFSGVVNVNIQDAVDQLCSDQPTVFKHGADTDSIPSGLPWRMDGTHLGTAGNHQQALLEYNALNAVF